MGKNLDNCTCYYLCAPDDKAQMIADPNGAYQDVLVARKLAALDEQEAEKRGQRKALLDLAVECANRIGKLKNIPTPMTPDALARTCGITEIAEWAREQLTAIGHADQPQPEQEGPR